MTTGSFSDEQLTAYLDGQLNSADAAALEAALAMDATLADRLAELDFPKDVLRREADEVLEMAPAMDLPPAQRASQPYLPIAASLILGALLGVFGMSLVPAEDDWIDAIASYQALYVPETLSAPAQPAAQTQEVITAFEESLGVSLTGVTSIDGLAFRRAQTLGFEGRPLLQLAYVTDAGVPVALCLVSVDQSDRLARNSRQYGLATIDWVRDGVGYVLIGGVEAEHLLAFYGQLPGA